MNIKDIEKVIGLVLYSIERALLNSDDKFKFTFELNNDEKKTNVNLSVAFSILNDLNETKQDGLNETNQNEYDERRRRIYRIFNFALDIIKKNKIEDSTIKSLVIMMENNKEKIQIDTERK